MTTKRIASLFLASAGLLAAASPAHAANNDTKTVTWNCPMGQSCLTTPDSFANIGIYGSPTAQCQVSYRNLTPGSSIQILNKYSNSLTAPTTGYNQVGSIIGKFSDDYFKGQLWARNGYSFSAGGSVPTKISVRYRIDTGNCSF